MPCFGEVPSEAGIGRVAGGMGHTPGVRNGAQGPASRQGRTRPSEAQDKAITAGAGGGGTQEAADTELGNPA